MTAFYELGGSVEQAEEILSLHLENLRELARFIYASSSSVYAGLEELPYREDQRVDQPIHVPAVIEGRAEIRTQHGLGQRGAEPLEDRYIVLDQRFMQHRRDGADPRVESSGGRGTPSSS